MEKNFRVGVMPGGALHPVVGFDVIPGTEDEMTVGDLFDVTRLDLGTGFSIRADGADVTMDTPVSELEDGTTIIATRAIRGN